MVPDPRELSMLEEGLIELTTEYHVYSLLEAVSMQISMQVHIWSGYDTELSIKLNLEVTKAR